MKRRDFVKTSLVAGAATTVPVTLQTASQTTAHAADKAAQEFYELRVYSLKPGADGKALHDFLQGAALPAWNRLGSKPIGVFTPRDAAEVPQVFVLIPHASLEAFAAAPSRLAADADFQKAGAGYIDLPSSDPAYARFESSLMRAFAGMPKVEQPVSPQVKTRVFELRTYESHSEKAALKKIEMFNNGEIDIMRRVGLGPVFYGEMLIGQRLPNLTYMLSAEDADAHKKHWSAFVADGEWKKISAIPEYANSRIVSKISNKFLLPTDYSQI